jgi:ribose transport system substrate-binding protein
LWLGAAELTTELAMDYKARMTGMMFRKRMAENEAMLREAGFREVMREHPRIRIIAEIPAWGLRDRAMSIMEDILVKIPDVGGVFAINDNSALGALDAIEAAGKKTVIIGYDAIPEVRKAIDKGTIYGAVIQYPEKIGSMTIETIAAFFLAHKSLPAVIVPVGVLTRESK